MRIMKYDSGNIVIHGCKLYVKGDHAYTCNLQP